MEKLRVMSIMAHQDDFEFEAAGLFAMLRKHYGNDVELKVLTTSRGASGHHIYDTDATALMRDGEPTLGRRRPWRRACIRVSRLAC